jgi:hypothetical protein
MAENNKVLQPRLGDFLLKVSSSKGSAGYSFFDEEFFSD